MIKHNYWTQI